MKFVRIIFHSIPVLFCWWITAYVLIPRLNIRNQQERVVFYFFLLVCIFFIGQACVSSYINFSKNRSKLDLIPAIISAAFILWVLF